MERLQDAGGEKGQASMMIYFGIFSSIMLRKNIVNILIFHDVKHKTANLFVYKVHSAALQTGDTVFCNLDK